MLNAELKSMNSILTYESLFSRWVRARWRVEEIASSVERFGRYANWSGSSVLGRLVLMLCMTSRSKHYGQSMYFTELLETHDDAFPSLSDSTSIRLFKELHVKVYIQT